MKIESMRDQVRSVAQRWRNQYKTGDFSGNKIAVQRALDSLDAETATEKDVAAIIGNSWWICPRTCNECGIETYAAIQLGETLDFESRTATICLPCLRKAVALLEEQRQDYLVSQRYEPKTASGTECFSEGVDAAHTAARKAFEDGIVAPVAPQTLTTTSTLRTER